MFYIQPTHSPVSCYFPIHSYASLLSRPLLGYFPLLFSTPPLPPPLVGLCSFDRCVVLSAHTHNNLFSFCLFINIAGLNLPCLLGSGTHCHFYCHWPLATVHSDVCECVASDKEFLFASQIAYSPSAHAAPDCPEITPPHNT